MKTMQNYPEIGAESSNSISVPVKVQQKDGQQVVSARELYEFLSPTERFGNWCKRMFSYGFIESQDYTLLTFLHPQNNQELTDYALTIDCAKEIAMIQRTDKGKQARLYFIECEKQLQAERAKKEHDKQTKETTKLSRKIDKLLKEHDELKAYIVKVNTTPPVVPAVELKNKVLAGVKYITETPYAAKRFQDVYDDFLKDLKHIYNIPLDRMYARPGEDAIDTLIREGYTRQLDELATYKYTSRPQ